jgi:hypothetical protein
MKYILILLLFFSLLLVSSCSETDPTPSLNKEEPYTLVDNRIIDLNGDGKDEQITTLINFDELNNRLYLKVQINDKETQFEIINPRKLTSMNKMEFIKLENEQKGVFIKFYSVLEEMNRDKNDLYSSDSSSVIITYNNEDIHMILNQFETKMNSADNYELKYKGNHSISLLDKATGFSIEFKAYVAETLEEIYEKGFESLDQLNTPLVMSLKKYYQIKYEDIDKDGIDEIIASTYIPGVYHNDVLGVIDYVYKFNSSMGSYVLAKEQLWYNKLLDSPMIHEQLYN